MTARRASAEIQGYISSKRKTKVYTGLLLSVAQDVVKTEVEEADVLEVAFGMVYTHNSCLQEYQIPEITLQK